MANSAEAMKVARVKGREDSESTEGNAEQWTLYVDDASNDTRFGASVIVISLEGHKIHCAIHFVFKASNNHYANV